MAPQLSLVLPVFNEEDVVPVLLQRLGTLLDSLQLRTEVIFVDDGSVDGTARLLRDAAQRDPRLRLVCLSRNFGHQPAISAGIDRAEGDAVVVMDADLQDPPEVVAELVARWQQGFDVVHARRRRRAGESWMKLLTARVFYRLFAAIAPVPTVPDSGDFRLMSRRVVLAMRGLEESHRFLRGLVAWVGFRQTVVEYDRPERPAGKTKFPFNRMASFAMDGITSFSTAPLRLATYLGLVVGLLAVAVAGWAAWDHFVAHRTVQGWTSLIVVVVADRRGAVRPHRHRRGVRRADLRGGQAAAALHRQRGVLLRRGQRAFPEVPRPMTPREGGGLPVSLPAAMLWLFALAAAPLLLGTVPPLQDLPNHLASAYIAEHIADYPALEVNGYLRSNSALALWLHLLGGPLGLAGAARLFVALVLAASAASLAWLGWTVGGPERMASIALLGWPLVHHFFVATGLLNFSLGLAGAWTALALAYRKARPGRSDAPPWLTSLALVAVSVAAWYAHPFPITIATGLVVLDALTPDAGGEPQRAGFPKLTTGWVHRAWAAALPFLPALVLSLATAAAHLLKPAERRILPASGMHFDPPWETFARLWTHGPVAFSWLEATTLLPAVALLVLAWRERRRPVPFFTWPVMALMVLAVFCLPASGSNWGLLNARFIPFVWVGLLLRAPPSLPRWLQIALPVAALAYGGGLWADYTRLEQERRQFTSAIRAVPEHAALLPLVFDAHGSATFTEPLKHAWGYYVLARATSAPLLFAVERSYPLTYRTWPPPELIPPALDEFAGRNESPAHICADSRPPTRRPTLRHLLAGTLGAVLARRRSGVRPRADLGRPPGVLERAPARLRSRPRPGSARPLCAPTPLTDGHAHPRSSRWNARGSPGRWPSSSISPSPGDTSTGTVRADGSRRSRTSTTSPTPSSTARRSSASRRPRPTT